METAAKLDGSDPQRGACEASMRRVLGGLKGCRYPDTFDWSVYDTIAGRHAANPPRGGTVFRTTFKLVNHHASCTRCHYAFELDTYGRGCVHNCVYCYAKEQLSAHGYWNRPYPFPVDLAQVRKVFYTVFETDAPSPWRDVMQKRVPLRLGSMSDCFMWMDRKYKVSLEMLKILSFYNYPYIIFTRSDLLATDAYLKALRPDLAAVQMSVSGGNEVLTQAIEPGAPGVQRRLAALRALAEAGIWTTARMNPLFPMFPDGWFTDPASIVRRFGSKQACPRFRIFDWDFLDALKEARVPSVLAGFVRLSTVALRRMSEATGVDFKPFFRDELQTPHGDKKFSDAEIAYYYTTMRDSCQRLGMRFTTCYIGNGIKDYVQHQQLWSNRTDCCDVKGNVSGFAASAQDVSWPVRIGHAPHRQKALQAQLVDEAVP